MHTHLEADAAPLAAGEWNPVRVEIFPFAHVFRAGSQLRVTVDAPGGNRAVWTFDTIAAGETVEIAHDTEYPSRDRAARRPRRRRPDGLPGVHAARPALPPSRPSVHPSAGSATPDGHSDGLEPEVLDGAGGSAPRRLTTTAATAWAARTARSIAAMSPRPSRPRPLASHHDTKPAVNVSPAPIVSTTGTGATATTPETHRRPDRRAPVPGGHEDDPVVSFRSNSAPSAANHSTSSLLALITSARASTRCSLARTPLGRRRPPAGS